MYHYRDCGLRNVFLTNGYREVETAYGPGVAIEDVEDLHAVIAQSMVEERPFLTGPDARFIRKLLELTQSQLAELLGVDDQWVRRWETLDRVPRQVDHGIRLVFRDLTRKSTRPLAEVIRQVETAGARRPRRTRYCHDAGSSPHWQLVCS